MTNLTKSGVCYKLASSPYIVDYAGFTFHFSTIYHQRNFQEKARIKQQWLTDSLSRRFKFQVECGLVALFQLYRQIETRGFYVVDSTGKVYDSLDKVSFKAVFS